MKYVSLDIETTCLEPSLDHILQVAMVVEDTAHPEIPVEELPSFCVLVSHKEIKGSAFALGMNARFLDQIAGRVPSPYEVIRSYELAAAMNEFLDAHFGTDTRVVVAGKNVAGFDLPFFPVSIRKRFLHRTLDPSVLFIDWDTDETPPDLATCKERAGLPREVAHDALDDARDVIRVFRAHLNNNPGEVK